MLRVHVVQLAYNLSNRDMEDMLCDAPSVRRFAGLGIEALPDQTALLNFRHRLEAHGLGRGLFAEVNTHLEAQGHELRTGTPVDATIIAAPSSAKNRKGEWDPEMRQTKKGNQRHFGMMAHVGVNSETGLVHSLAPTPANGADVSNAHQMLYGGEAQVWGVAGYQGVGLRPENRERDVEWHVAMRPGKRRQLDKSNPEEAAERRKATKRARVEHPFLYLKRPFGYGNVRYRGLAKNTERLALLFGLANPLIADGLAAA